MVSEEMSRKGFKRAFLETGLNYWTEFNLNVDIVLIVYMLCAKYKVEILK